MTPNQVVLILPSPPLVAVPFFVGQPGLDVPAELVKVDADANGNLIATAVTGDLR